MVEKKKSVCKKGKEFENKARYSVLRNWAGAVMRNSPGERKKKTKKQKTKTKKTPQKNKQNKRPNSLPTETRWFR